MRVAIGALEHETNTYADGTMGLTTLDDFRVERGREVFDLFNGTQTAIGGMIERARDLGAEVIPTLTAMAQPSGTIARETFEALLNELTQRIADAMPLDGLLLSLHGAGIAEGSDDIESDICEVLRAVVGPDVPIAVSYDLHGNVTQRNADLIDVGLGCHLYPHTDLYARGLEAADTIPRLRRREITPTTAVVRIPMLTPPATTDHGPASQVNERCRAVEEDPAVLACTFFHGFPYADGPHVGSHVWVTTDGDERLAREIANDVASTIWGMRERFRADVLLPDEAVHRARAIDGRPVVINETADNSGGGAPGDGTHLLRAMLDAGLDDAAFGFLWDPDVAAAAHTAGVGAVLDVTLGGKTDDLHGDPIEARARVEKVTDGRYRLSAWAPGMPQDHGPMALLRIGGIEVIVGSKRSQTFTPDVFALHDVDVRTRKIVALKSSHHFRTGFAPLAAAILTADGGGLTTMRPEIFPRARTPRPIWPLDDDVTFPSA